MIYSAIYSTIGLVFGILLYPKILLPLFYGIPRTIMLVLKKQRGARLIFLQLFGPAIYISFIILILFISKIISVDIYHFLFKSFFNLGSVGALLYMIYYAFTPKGKRELEKDFKELAMIK